MVTDEHIVCNSVKIPLMRVSFGKVRNISGVNQGFFFLRSNRKDYLNAQGLDARQNHL